MPQPIDPEKLKQGLAKTLDTVGQAARDTSSRVIGQARSLRESAADALEARRVPDEDPYERATVDYNAAHTSMTDTGLALLRQRERSTDLLALVEHLVNSIANTPKSFETAFEGVQLNRTAFVEAEEFARKDLEAARGVSNRRRCRHLGRRRRGEPRARSGDVDCDDLRRGVHRHGDLDAVGSGSHQRSTRVVGRRRAGGRRGRNRDGRSAPRTGRSDRLERGRGGAPHVDRALHEEEVRDTGSEAPALLALRENTAAVRSLETQIRALLERSTSVRELLRDNYTQSLAAFGQDFTGLSKADQARLASLVNSASSCAGLLGTRIVPETAGD